MFNLLLRLYIIVRQSLYCYTWRFCVYSSEQGVRGMQRTDKVIQPALSYRKNWAGYILKRLKESWQWYVLLLPALVYVFIFEYMPIYGLRIAFVDFKPRRGIGGSDWVGIEHFIRFFEYPKFWALLKNTLSITLLSLCTFPCAIIFALMLNEMHQLRLKKTVQMLTYAPHFLSEVVVCSLVLMMLNQSYGPVNNLLASMGIDRVPFMTKPDYFPSIYVWSGVWQNLGWSSILYISALASISPEQIEAAKIDGANRLQIIRYVNIPGIMPTISINFIMSVGRLLSVGYSKIFLLQNDLNLDASQVISTYVYQVGLVDFQYDYSAAIGLFNNIANILVLLIANRIVKRATDTGLF